MRRTSTPDITAVILIDANMAGPLPCLGDCQRQPEHLCDYVLNTQTRIRIARLPIDKMGIPDLRVLQYFVHLAASGIEGAIINETRWIIVTRDKGFCRSAEHECRSRTGGCGALVFEKGRVRTTVRGKPLCVEIAPVGSKRYGAGKSGDLQRVLEKINELLSQPPPS